MAKSDPSRRDLLGGAVAIALVAPTLSPAQATPKTLESTPEMDAVKAKLTSTLDEKELELLRGALGGNRQSAAARWRFQLTENSEPCFVVPVTPAKERKR